MQYSDSHPPDHHFFGETEETLQLLLGSNRCPQFRIRTLAELPARFPGSTSLYGGIVLPWCHNTIQFTMPAESEIRRRIAETGPITFAEFMDVALYWPDGGYYYRGDPIGGSGDYYTSPLAHPAFGALLAVQLFQMWRLLERPSSFHVIEPGAGSGGLCRDIITFASHLPDGFRDSLRYVCVDRGIAWEEGVSEAGVHRVVSTGLPFQPVEGCVLSNELLDAFPVHQVIGQGGVLKEVYVTVDGDSLTTVVGEPSTTRLANRLDSLGISLQEGQTAEVNLGLDRWVEEASQTLSRGFVLTVDYGRTAADLYSAEHRFRGTLTTFYRHTQTDAPLQRIGRQDMTAQVDFSSLIELGRRQGLETHWVHQSKRFSVQAWVGPIPAALVILGPDPAGICRQQLRDAGLGAPRRARGLQGAGARQGGRESGSLGVQRDCGNIRNDGTIARAPTEQPTPAGCGGPLSLCGAGVR